MAQFLHGEIWSNVASGTSANRKYHIDPRYLIKLEVVRSVGQPTGVPESGELVISNAWRHAGLPTVGMVVRIQTTTAGTFDEWRIADIEDESGPNPPTTRYTLEPISADLNRALYSTFDGLGVPSHQYTAVGTDAEGVIDEVVAMCGEAGLSHIAKGTIDPTQTFDIDAEGNGAAFIEAVRQTGRAPSEFQLRRNGSTNYLIDLLDEIGSSAPAVDLITKRNLDRTKRRQRGADMANRYQGRGKDDNTHRGLGYAFWLITARDTSDDYIVVADPRGGSYPGPLRFDGQLNNCYVSQLDVALSPVAIGANIEATQRIYVPDASLFTVGRYVEFFRSSAGVASERLWYLDNPDAQSLVGGQVYSRILPLELRSGAVNYAPNPIAATWSNLSNPPDGWETAGGGSRGQDTSDAAKKFSAGGYKMSGGMGVGGKIRSAEILVYDDAPYAWRLWAWVRDLGGTGAGTGFNASIVRADTNADVETEVTVAASDDWVLVEFEVTTTTYGGGGIQFQIRSNGDNASGIVVDSFGCQPLAWTRSDTYTPDACDIWHDVNDALERDALPIGYELSILDLEQVDPTAFADEALSVGGTLRIYDQDLDVQVTQRLLEYTRDYAKPGDVTIRCGARDKMLSELLAKKQQPTETIGEAVRAIVSGVTAGIGDGLFTDDDGLGTYEVVDGAGAGTSKFVSVPGEDVALSLNRILSKPFKTKL